jgi:hypothetical protein
MDSMLYEFLTANRQEMLALTQDRGFLTDGARKWAGWWTPGEDPLAAEKIEGHGASTLLALG